MQEMQKMWVRSLGQEDSLEEEMAMYSSILAWEIPQTEDPGRLQSIGLQKSQIWQWMSTAQHNWTHDLTYSQGFPVYRKISEPLARCFPWKEVNE